MKLLVILAVVLLSVDGREVPDQLQGSESQIQQESYLQESEEEIISDDWNSVQERSVCKPTISCTLAGGTCISNDDCDGTIDPKGCKGRQCVCCIPPKEEYRGCPEGYFHYPASDQCFMYFGGRSDQYRKHAEAEKICADNNGGMLAHPYDPIGLRDYIVTRYGSPARNYAWLGGRLPANTTTVRWDDNGAVLDNDNPMWYSYPRELTFTRCVLLMVNSGSWTLKPDKPLILIGCTDGRPFICEFVRE